jgi:hypothetical protein
MNAKSVAYELRGTYALLLSHKAMIGLAIIQRWGRDGGQSRRLLYGPSRWIAILCGRNPKLYSSWTEKPETFAARTYPTSIQDKNGAVTDNGKDAERTARADKSMHAYTIVAADYISPMSTNLWAPGDNLRSEGSTLAWHSASPPCRLPLG